MRKNTLFKSILAAKFMNNRGFTIIEMVAVIILLGIVSVAVIPRFVGPNTFNERAAHDVLITTLRVAQQASLGRSNVTFEISDLGDRWKFSAKSGATEIETIELSSKGVKLETGSAAILANPTNSCSSGTAFNTPVASFVLSFDNQGNLSSFANTSISLQTVDANFNGVRICVNDKVSSSVCVSPAGYAYSGDCDV